MDTPKDLSRRLQILQTEIEIEQRRRAQESKMIAKALSSISKEDVELLKGIVPELTIIAGYSEEALQSNNNGERAMVRKVSSLLREYLEQRLSYYEELL